MPNSPAFRFAEQFYKQGKLLIEKYLLTDKKVACKIEGLSIDTDDGMDGSDGLAADIVSTTTTSKRQASIQAVGRWKKELPGDGSKKKVIVTFNDVLALIKREGGGDVKKFPPTIITPMISPYRRKFSSSPATTINTTSCVPSISIPLSPQSVVMSEWDLTKSLMEIFGLKFSFFVTNNYTLFDGGKSFVGKSFNIRADFSYLLQPSSALSAAEIAQIFAGAYMKHAVNAKDTARVGHLWTVLIVERVFTITVLDLLHIQMNPSWEVLIHLFIQILFRELKNLNVNLVVNACTVINMEGKLIVEFVEIFLINIVELNF